MKDQKKDLSRIEGKGIQSVCINLTEEQRKQIQEFWKETGSLGNVEIQVEVVNDKISPASIQVGTAK